MEDRGVSRVYSEIESNKKRIAKQQEKTLEKKAMKPTQIQIPPVDMIYP